MRTRGTSNQAQFDFQTPLVVPQGQTCLVNVEGFFGTIPSLFSSEYILSSLNTFTFGNVIDVWSTVIDVLIRASNEKMNNPVNIVTFLCDFLVAIDDPTVAVVLPRLGYSTDVTGDVYILYDSASTTTSFLLQNVSTALNLTLTSDEKIKDWLQTYVSLLGAPKFALTKSGTGSFYMRGPWVMCLGLSPIVTHSISPGSNLICDLQVNGLQFMNLNCNIGRSVMATQTTDLRLTPSDILWTIPLPGDPPEKTFYTNFSAGGKVPCSSSIIETLEIYFTDKYNYNVVGLTDWTVVLTFDYMDKEKPAQPITSKDVRRFITSY